MFSGSFPTPLKRPLSQEKPIKETATHKKTTIVAKPSNHEEPTTEIIKPQKKNRLQTRLLQEKPVYEKI